MSNREREIERLRDESTSSHLAFCQRVEELKKKLADPATPDEDKARIRGKLHTMAAQERQAKERVSKIGKAL